MRRLTILRASQSRSASLSAAVTPQRTSSPGPIAPTVSPPTVTVAFRTRCTTARKTSLDSARDLALDLDHRSPGDRQRGHRIGISRRGKISPPPPALSPALAVHVGAPDPHHHLGLAHSGMNEPSLRGT